MNTRPPRALAWGLTLLLGVTLALAGAAPASAWDDDHSAMQGSAAPMGQTNGPVWAVEIAGGKIFVGGGFTSTRPAGAALGHQETGQGYLAAFDADTGEPITGFDPELRNTWNSAPPIVRAMALSPDGETLYVGGDFNQIDGQTTEHVAAFDTATGDFLGVVGWNGTDGFVAALAVSHDGETLYAGGAFTRANWSHRADLAAFDLTDGSLRDWAPTISRPVTGESLRAVALAVSEDDSQVFLAGSFREVNGEDAQGFMATSAATGENLSAYADDYLYSPNSWGTSLAVDGDTVYLGGRDDRTGSLVRTEGVFAINTDNGSERWYANCYGDTFAILPLDDELYVASHAHDCSDNGGMPNQSPTVYLALRTLDRATGEDKAYFVQTSGVSGDPDTRLMSRALATDGQQVVMGGGFSTTNFQDQSNLTRFLTGSSPAERAAWPAASTCHRCGYVDLTVLEASDRDDRNLTYEIYRGWQTTDPIAVIDEVSYPFVLDTFSYRDRGVSRGDQVYYRVLTKDEAGNEVWSVRTPTITVGDEDSLDAAVAATTFSASAAESTAPMAAPEAKQGGSGLGTLSRSATAGKAKAGLAVVPQPTTDAQRAAEVAARQFGLKVDGSRAKKKSRLRLTTQSTPLMDDQSVPTRVGRARR